jgi:hypothetical protein
MMADAAALRPRVVVMNDTSGRSHHGCARVMRLLYAGLGREDLQVTARSAARHDWAQDAAFLAQLRQADLVVINGEGTLHHGRPAGARLLAVVNHPDCKAPVAVINALWQDNPQDWAAMLGRCALVSARDARSAAAMRVGGAEVRVVPDLSLTGGAAMQDAPRDGLIVGDSVRIAARRALALAGARLDARALVPTKTRTGAIWHWPPTRAVLSAIYHGAMPPLPPLHLCADEAAYLATLGQAEMHLTGRFHAICLSLITGTPFLATASNSWKIEALLADAGLPASRIIAPSALADLTRQDIDQPLTPGEVTGIAGFLARAQVDGAALFSDLGALARGEK